MNGQWDARPVRMVALIAAGVVLLAVGYLAAFFGLLWLVLAVLS